MRTLLAVMVAGALGAAARYGVDGLVSGRGSAQFPWGTFVVNLSGAFVLGLVFTLTTERLVVDATVRTALTVGFIGSYTTFSTWVLETVQLGQSGSYALAAVNAAGSVVGGLVALLAGVALGRVV